MALPVWFEIATFVGLTVLLLADLAIVARRPHEPSVKEASIWVGFYVTLALAFGDTSQNAISTLFQSLSLPFEQTLQRFTAEWKRATHHVAGISGVSNRSAGIELAQRLGDPRIRAVPSPGTGQVDARNAAICLARGLMICWLDDDDWWDDPAHLSILQETAGIVVTVINTGRIRIRLAHQTR